MFRSHVLAVLKVLRMHRSDGRQDEPSPTIYSLFDGCDDRFYVMCIQPSRCQARIVFRGTQPNIPCLSLFYKDQVCLPFLLRRHNRTIPSPVFDFSISRERAENTRRILRTQFLPAHLAYLGGFLVLVVL